MEDPYQVLGVAPGATWEEVRRARRRLAKALHPDVHDPAGRAHAEARLATVNRAFDQVRAARAATDGAATTPADTAGGAGPEAAEGNAFGVEALPVDAFEMLLLAAVNLGDVVAAEEPYLLAVLLDEPWPCQATLDLVPVAGGSIVTVDVAPRSFGVCPTGSQVRDALMAEIERQAGNS